MRLFGPPNIEKMKAKHDVAGLIKALDYQKDYPTRVAAATALGEIGDPRAVESLLAAQWASYCDYALSDRFREAVDRALAQMGDPRALKALKKIVFGDSRPFPQSARVSAIWSLGLFGGGAVEALTAALQKSSYEEAEVAARMLVQVGSPALEPLVGALRSTGRRQELAAWALGQMADPRAAPHLVAVLPAMKDSAAVAEALHKLGAPAVEALIGALQDRSGALGGAAARTLGAMGDMRAVEPLILVLKSGSGYARESAAVALGRLGDTRAVEPLILVLKSDSGHARETAALALGRLGDPRAIPWLIGAMAEGQETVREAARLALRGVLDHAPAAPGTLWKDLAPDLHRHAVDSIAAAGGKHAGALLIEALEGADRAVRIDAATALGKSSAPDAAPALTQALRDADPGVRAAAAKALGVMGDLSGMPASGLGAEPGGSRSLPEAHGQMRTVAVPALIEALQDEDAGVRRAAVKALAQLSALNARSALEGSLKDSESSVRRAAAKALADLHLFDAIPALQKALRDKEAIVRRAAVEALEALGGEDTLPALEQALGSEYEDVRNRARQALDKIRERIREEEESAEAWREWEQDQYNRSY